MHPHDLHRFHEIALSDEDPAEHYLNDKRRSH